MKKISLFCFVILLSCQCFSQTFPTIYATLASGSWATTTTWETFTGNATNTPGAIGTGTAATGVPSGTHFIYIRSGHTITMGAANRACLGMLVESTGALLAGETTARRLQIVNGGTGFAAPQNWSITNNGTIGGATDGIFFEPGTAIGTVTLTGTGIYNIGRIRIPGGLAGSGSGTVSVIIDANMNFNVTGNYVLSAYYNGVAADNYTVTINSGKRVTASGTAFFHNGGTSSVAAGNYTYNINGILDLSATSGNLNLSPLGATGSVLTLNVNGTLKTGSGAFNCDTLGTSTGQTDFGKVVLNIGNGGTIDATASNGTFKTGTYRGQFFVLSGTGSLKRTVGSTATLFPVGTSATSYSPVSLTNSGTVSDSFSISLSNTLANPPAFGYVNKQWTITDLGTGLSPNLAASFGWVTADNGTLNRSNPISVIRYSGAAWLPYGLTGSISGTGTIADPYMVTSSNGFTSFGNFGIDNDASTMPLNLTSFTASSSASGATLNWATTNEVNVDGFGVEKSANGSDYATIGKVTAKGAASNSYSYTDASAAGTTYYRLKITGKDGSFKYSNVLTVTGNATTSALSVFTNPVASNLLVSHTAAGKDAALKIVSLDGKTLATIKVAAGSKQTSADVSKLLRGNYMLVYVNGQQQNAISILKQ